MATLPPYPTDGTGPKPLYLANRLPYHIRPCM